MIKFLSRNIVRFVLIVLIQVLLVNNINISGYFTPYFYILFILLIPFETPGWVLLVSGFLLGLTIDAFVNTLGMHTAATVLAAFVRPYVLQVFSPRDGYEPGTFPRLYYFGFSWFLRYTIIIVFVHHLFLFYIEIFRLSNFFDTLLRVILSTLLTTFFIVLSQYFIFRK